MTGWTQTKALNVARADHTATALASGQVLAFGGYGYVAGGDTTVGLASAEIFDYQTQAWNLTGSAFYERTLHTATLLQSGKVLVAGGTHNTNTELYDPQTGQFYATGRLHMARFGHAAVLLADGRALAICGSVDGVNVLNPYGWTTTAEIYDPTSQTWSLTKHQLKVARFLPTATVLRDGTVLVVGGTSPLVEDRTTEIFNPADGTWTITGSPFYVRRYHSATRLPDGQVIVAGGAGYIPQNAPPFTVVPPLAETELYNPASGNWYTVGKLNVARSNHRAIALTDGRVLAIGGNGVNPHTQRGIALDSVESFDPHTLVWTVSSPLNTPRAQHTATLLQAPSASSKVGTTSILVAGGVTNASNEVLGSAEILAFPPSETISERL